MKTRMHSANTNFPSLTTEALAALQRSGLSRRSFLQGTGALIVGFPAWGACWARLMHRRRAKWP